jgi:hypothetical protein
MPRITAAEKRAQQQAKEQAIREREEVARRKQAKKWAVPFYLLDRSQATIGTRSFSPLAMKRMRARMPLFSKNSQCSEPTVSQRQTLRIRYLISHSAVMNVETSKAPKQPKSAPSKSKETPSTSYTAPSVQAENVRSLF